MELSTAEVVTEGQEIQIKLIDWLKKTCQYGRTSFLPLSVASDIMSKRIKALTMDHSVKAASEFMDKNRIRHIAVIDGESDSGDAKHFIGVISRRDILRLSYEDKPKNAKADIDPKSLRQLLSQIVTRNPFSVTPDASISEVITIMIEHHVDLVPVLEGGGLVGVITTVDIIKLYVMLDKALKRVCAKGATKNVIDLSDLTAEQSQTMFLTVYRMVHEIMAKEVICLEETDSIKNATVLIQENEIRHIPVLNSAGQMVGIASDRDVLRSLPFAGKRPLSKPVKFRDVLFRKSETNKAAQTQIGEIMTKRVRHISPSSTVRDAADLMCKYRIGCVPVLSKEKKICGIITVIDVMKTLLSIYQV